MSNFRHIRPLMLGLLVLAGSASAAAAATPPAPAPPACVLGAAPGIYANCVPIGVIPTITSSIDCAPGRYSSKVQPHGFPIGQTATFRLNLESRTDRAVSKVIVNGRLSPSQRSFVNRFLGRYDASDNALWSPVAGQVLVTLKADGRLAMTSTMDITGSNCLL